MNTMATQIPTSEDSEQLKTQPKTTRTASRAESLADRIEEGAATLAAFAEGLSEEEWRKPVSKSGRDGRSVGVIVHHVASVYPIEVDLARTQLAPKTVLQDLKFAEIMVCIGRCLLGLRLDMRYVNRLLGQDNLFAQPDQADGGRVGPEWYLSNKQGLREGMRLLGEIKQEFLCLGRIDEKWHLVLDKAFGPQLREILTPCMPSPSDETAIMAAHYLTEHAKTYDLPLPSPFDGKPSSAKDGGDKVKVILDPEQSKRMVLKLLEQQESMLSDLWRSAEQRASSAAREQDAPSDPPRHFSATCRDLDRAIELFMYLKKHRL